MLIRGRNCEKSIKKCVRSIRRQTYSRWKAVISLDDPLDNSIEETRIAVADDNRFVILVNSMHNGLCKNMYSIIKSADNLFSPSDRAVALVIDADDFVSKVAFRTVANAFTKDSQVAITHGSYMKMSRSKRTKVSQPYPRKGNIRKLPWRGSHLKAIRWDIIKKAKPKWFQYNGVWLEAASDLALMFNCVESAGGLSRVKHIHRIIYYWNDNVTKKKKVAQRRCERILRAL